MSDRSVLDVFRGAWREALTAEQRHHQVLMVGCMASLTVVFIPSYPAFWLLEQAGVYDIDDGWSWPRSLR